MDADADEEDEEGFVANEAPPHSCVYCGIHDTGSVVCCNQCNKWFCNGRGQTPASHIVTHLVRAGHREVSLHTESELGDTVLECYSCGGRNVLNLGFIHGSTESVVVLLCRDPCLLTNALNDLEWDQNGWCALIKDKCFLPWLVKVPSDKEQLRARHINTTTILNLEDLWKQDPGASLEDLEHHSVESSVCPLLLRYEDAFQYQNLFAPLVKLEADYDKRMKESQTKVTLVKGGL